MEKNSFRFNSATSHNNEKEIKLLLAIPKKPSEILIQTQNVEYPQSPSHSIYSEESLEDNTVIPNQAIVPEPIDIKKSLSIFFDFFLIDLAPTCLSNNHPSIWTSSKLNCSSPPGQYLPFSSEVKLATPSPISSSHDTILKNYDSLHLNDSIVSKKRKLSPSLPAINLTLDNSNSNNLNCINSQFSNNRKHPPSSMLFENDIESKSSTSSPMEMVNRNLKQLSEKKGVIEPNLSSTREKSAAFVNALVNTTNSDSIINNVANKASSVFLKKSLRPSLFKISLKNAVDDFDRALFY